MENVEPRAETIGRDNSGGRQAERPPPQPSPKNIDARGPAGSSDRRERPRGPEGGPNRAKRGREENGCAGANEGVSPEAEGGRFVRPE